MLDQKPSFHRKARHQSPCATDRKIETMFLRLNHPVAWGHPIDGWRVCWIGGWDRGHLFFVVMVKRSQ